MKPGDMARRSVQALRALPRTLREDLVTSAVGPNPHAGRPRWLEWRPALMAPMVMCAVGVLIVNTNEYAFRYRMGVSLGILFAGIQSVALVAALYRPVLAWWATVLVMIVLTPFAANAGPFGATFPWNGTVIGLQAAALFLLALRVRPRTAAQALTISLVTGLVCGAVNPWRQGGVGIAVAVLVIAVVVGAALRGIGVARTQLVVQEELTAEERARRTLLEERNRIARELHDVVAHHMSVISIQAQVAPHLVENPSEELKENLAGIRENAVEALTELRRVLGVLRSEEPAQQAARHAPQPTLDRLDELIGNARGAGLTVTAGATGEPHPLSPGVELSAYRIVQEALSNAMRHAPGAQVRVEIGRHPSGVTVRVTNTAPDRAVPASAGAGHGLLGMRERTAMLGGDLATGPTPDGGYEVTATLPAQPLPAHPRPATDGFPPR